MLYNQEGYLDSTAYQALRNIEQEMKVVFICSPYEGDVEINTLRARRYGRYAATKKAAPVIPHLMYTQFLDDNSFEERELGLDMGLTLLGKCQEMWVFGSKISKVMELEIEEARMMRIPIRYHDIHCKPVGAR